MLKKKLKTLALIFLLISLISTLCFATEGTGVIEPRDSESTDNSIMTITSEVPVTTSEDTESDDNTILGTEDGTDEVDVDESDETYAEDLISDDLYMFEDTIEIDNLVDGNAYLFGKSVTINGQVGGDVFVIAENLTLSEDSYIYGNLFVVADNITINGIACDLYSLSQKVIINETGVVLRDMRSIAGNIELSGSIGRNTHLNVGTFTVKETAVIYGNLNYESSSAVVVPEGIVEGTISYKQKTVADTSNTVTDYVMSCATAVLHSLIVLGLLLLFASKFTKKSEAVMQEKNIFATLGFGLLSWVAIVIVLFIALMLLVTVVGAPLSFVLALLCSVPLTIASSLTIICVASLLGNKVAFLGKAHNLLSVIIVAIVVWALSLIPFGIGSIINLIILLIGLGLFARSIFTKKENTENTSVVE